MKIFEWACLSLCSSWESCCSSSARKNLPKLGGMLGRGVKKIRGRVE